MTQRHIRQNGSGKDSLWPCQLKARRWGSVSVSCVWQCWGWRGWGWGQGGAKEKQQSNNFYVSVEVSKCSPNLRPVGRPSPQLHTGPPKLSSQTDPALSSTITSTLRPNESTLYQERHSFYDLHIRQIKAFLHYIMAVEWLLKMHYNMYVCTSWTLFLSICLSKEGEQMSLTQSSFFLEIIQK